MNDEMFVTKRSGEKEPLLFDKILNRIKKLGYEADIHINYTALVIKIIDQIYDNIKTTTIDELTAEYCASLTSTHPDYGLLADRLVISNHQKNTLSSFYDTMRLLHENINDKGMPNPLLSEETWGVIERYKEEWNMVVDYSRDYLIDYFGFKTLERSYLIRINGKIIERIQDMWLRVSIGIHGNNLELVKETYFYMSQKYFIHATPTLYNSGTCTPQLSSCFLVAMEEDSLNGIFNTLKDCATISKYAGGIGLHLHNIRATNSKIYGINGSSSGIVPMLKLFNDTARYVNQGGKRNGSFAVYLEPWHADIELFLELKKNHGDEESKSRDLFYGLWVPDLFMERVKTNTNWSLFCPNQCPGLDEVFGIPFQTLYEKYETEGRFIKQVKARDLWFKILDAQMETGNPYLLYKDACNMKSNQSHLGTIKSSNLCTEIIQYSDRNETSVCNLASIALPRFVRGGTFNYEFLHEIAEIVTGNMNKVIDVSFYPTEKTRKSNLAHRPLGIGVQGLADVFIMMNIPFGSEESRVINRNIFETIYHAALCKSNQLAKDRKMLPFSSSSFTEEELKLPSEWRGSYSSFQGSYTSRGILQFDLWGQTAERYDWSTLKESIIQHGLRNSLLLAPMPTASTSQILGYNECFEPMTSNMYTRRTMAGEFVVPNKYLIRELLAMNMWNEDVKQNIILNRGSVQQLTFLPKEMREKYKIVWEIPMKSLIDMSVDRGAFIDQSQSLNLWIEDPTYSSLTSMHFHGWKNGLKTGIYYLRRKAKHRAQQFTIEPDSNPACEMCSA